MLEIIVSHNTSLIDEEDVQGFNKIFQSITVHFKDYIFIFCIFQNFMISSNRLQSFFSKKHKSESKSIFF